MISVILIMVAAACNAVMDTCAHHYTKSIFKKLTPMFWNAEISWRNKYNAWNPKYGRKRWVLCGGKIKILKPVHFTDAWHLFKSTMIALLISAIVFYKPIVNCYVDIAILGTAWNLAFSLFYNRIFKL